MPEFNHSPSISVLQSLAGGSLADSLDNVNKAVRLWYILRKLGEYKSENFTYKECYKSIYNFFPNNQEKYPENQTEYSSKSDCISNKNIQKILFDEQLDPEEKWEKWCQNFINYYINQSGKSLEYLQAHLQRLAREKPFHVLGKSIYQNDLCKSLVERKFLMFSSETKSFLLPNQFPDLIIREQGLDQNTDLFEPADTSYLMDDFSSFARMFSEPLKGVQRFHLHGDYQILNELQATRIANYQNQLRKIWQNGSGIPCELTYTSSSQVKTYSVIVYPVCLYYYQRSFYLCAFECQEDDNQKKWYNYRLDRIQALKCLDWQEDRSIIPISLINLCQEIDDIDLVNEIQDGITEAYGFDFYQPAQLVLLRFSRDFHDRYIKNTWRHNTFKLVEPNKINGLLNKLGLNTSDRSLIDKRIQTHPDDAYYTMNYRVKDNSVIMRLRAWCPNVEVLYPLDLRQRMRDDMQQTWELYSDDK